MMALLSRLFTWAGGSSLTVPLLAVGMLMYVHTQFKERDARLVDAGKQQCNSSWLVAFSKQQRDSARRDAQRATDILEGERNVMEGLRDELQATHDKFAGYIPGNDPRCLSDSVLDALGRLGSVDGSR